MGLSRLNVWVSELDEPCKMSERTWYVLIYSCDGKILTHCGQRYLLLPAPCGHLETQVPPGTYLVKAVWSYHLAGGVYHANHFTDAAIVHVCCDEDACVTLFNPRAHRCGIIYGLAVNDLAAKGVIPQALAQEINDRVATVNAAIAPTAEPAFEVGHLGEIDQVLRTIVTG